MTNYVLEVSLLSHSAMRFDCQFSQSVNAAKFRLISEEFELLLGDILVVSGVAP
jgi:hypothetical protein